MAVTLCDQWDGPYGVAADRLYGLSDLDDAVDGEQAEGQVAEGGRDPGAVAAVGLVIVLAPDGVAGSVDEVLDSPVLPGVCGDLVRRQVCSAGDHECDLLAEWLSGQVGDVPADEGEPGRIRQAEFFPGIGGPGGPAVDPAMTALFGHMIGLSGDQLAAGGYGRGVQGRPVAFDGQQVIGAAVPGQVAGGACRSRPGPGQSLAAVRAGDAP